MPFFKYLMLAKLPSHQRIADRQYYNILYFGLLLSETAFLLNFVSSSTSDALPIFTVIYFAVSTSFVI